MFAGPLNTVCSLQRLDRGFLAILFEDGKSMTERPGRTASPTDGGRADARADRRSSRRRRRRTVDSGEYDNATTTTTTTAAAAGISRSVPSTV
jgi:hypothetical protein